MCGIGQLCLHRLAPALIAAILISSLSAHIAPAAPDNLSFNGGRTLLNPIKVFLIFWSGPNVALDPSQPDGKGNFESLTQQFFNDVGGTLYFNVATEYTGTCPRGPGKCVVIDGQNAISVIQVVEDASGYTAGAGTANNPLTDADIQNEVIKIISQNNWSIDVNSIVIVFTGVFTDILGNADPEVVECNGSKGCSSTTYCAYHNTMTVNNTQIVYIYMSDASFSGAGCTESLTTAVNGQLNADREVALMTHEFFESVTDPVLGTAWIVNSMDTNNGAEIGDLCNQQSTVIPFLGGANPNVQFVVQLLWDNVSSRCVPGFVSSSPSFNHVAFDIQTGGDDLRGDSSANAALQVGMDTLQFTLKSQSEGAWNNNTVHTKTFEMPPTQLSSLGQNTVTLTSHNNFPETDDNWNIQSIKITVSDDQGDQACLANQFGNPFVRLTGSAPSVTINPQAGC